jgi:hypothetical protein
VGRSKTPLDMGYVDMGDGCVMVVPVGRDLLGRFLGVCCGADTPSIGEKGELLVQNGPHLAKKGVWVRFVGWGGVGVPAGVRPHCTGLKTQRSLG